MLLSVGPAHAIDWDGDFPNDGNFDGKIDAIDNWDPNILPFPSTGVIFNPNATYTVLFGLDVETSLVRIENGDVTFTSGGAATNNVYSISNSLRVFSTLTLDGLDLAPGSGAPFGLFVEDGGTLNVQDSLITVPSTQINLSNSTAGGTLHLDNSQIQGAVGMLIAAPGVGGSQVTLDNGSSIEIQADPFGNIVSLGDNNEPGRLDVLGGSTVEADADLRMGIFDTAVPVTQNVIEVSGTGSEFRIINSRPSFIGSTAALAGPNARLTVTNGAEVELSGTVDVRAPGQVENLGGTLEIGGTAQVDGDFLQNTSGAVSSGTSSTVFDSSAVFSGTSSFTLGGGTVTFNDTADFTTGVAYTHTGGGVVFNDPAVLEMTEIGFGADTSTTITAAWNVNDDVAFARRLRAGDAADTRSNINVFNGGVLRNTETGTLSDLAVGFNGRGDLAIMGDGLVDIYDDVIFGQNAGSRGNAMIAGTGELRANRNGGGSNVFIGFNGTGSVQMSGASTLTVGNNLVIQAANNGGLDSSFLGFASSGSPSTDDTSVTVGGDLLIGTNTVGGTVGGVLLSGLGTVDVANLTQVRASGRLDITGGATVTTTSLTTDTGAELNFSNGELKVDGGVGTINHGTLVVGDGPGTTTGNAVFTVSNGATVNLDAGLTTGQVGGRGFVTVTDANSKLLHNNTNTDTRIGDGGLGGLDVGGLALAELGDLLVVGDGSNGDGTVNVFGAVGGQPSILRVNGGGTASRIDIGLNDGNGLVLVSGGGFLETQGVINVGNGSDNPLSPRELRVTGQGDGLGSAVVARQVNVLSGQAKLSIQLGAQVDLTESLTLDNAGDWIQSGGTLTVPAINRLDGLIAINGGLIRTGQFNGDFTNDGGTLTPDSGSAGGSRFDDLNITGEYIQGDDAWLQVQLGGTTPGTQHDRLIADVVMLNAGTGLEVELLNGFNPTLGDSFEIVLANGVFGTFGETTGLNLGGGLQLEIVYGFDRITLNTVAGFLDGDYNGDGFVSQADLDLVLLNWGDSVIPPAWVATDQFDGVQVSQNELDGVLLNWGDGTPPSASAIPEPGAAVLLGLPMWSAMTRRRRAA